VYHVTLRIYPSPANDQFVQRTPVVTNRASEPFYTYAATRQTGEPNHGAASGGGSVWFTWTAPSDGTLTLQLSNLNFVAVLGVYTGSVVNALTKITNSTSPSVPMRISARNGVAYQFAIDGNGGSVGGGVLNLHFLATPNDFFANRIPVTGEIVNLRGDNRDATREPGEPVLTNPRGSQFVPQATLWWEWTAPRTGVVAFTSRDSEIRLAGVVWWGNELVNLNAVHQLNLASGETHSLALHRPAKRFPFPSEVLAANVENWVWKSPMFQPLPTTTSRRGES
jgi:hypothetical protein